jgi:hypothetical protein
MKNTLFIAFVILLLILTACRAAVPLPPLTATKGIQFTLAPDQTATLATAGMSIRLIGVAGDARCPSDIECAMSGPVSLSLLVHVGDEDAARIDLQTFTDNTGQAPDMQFQGIKDRVIYEAYLIRVLGVSPYPFNLSGKIKDSEYRVKLIVSQQ